MDFGVLVDHGQGIGGGAHLAGAGGVMAGPDILPEPEIKGGVGVQDFVRGAQPFPDKIIEGGVLEEVNADPYAIPGTLSDPEVPQSSCSPTRGPYGGSVETTVICPEERLI